MNQLTNKISNIFGKPKVVESTTVYDNSQFNKAIDKRLPINEQALEFFSEVYGYENEKKLIYRALLANGQINTLLYGLPATGKTVIVDAIVKNCKGVVKFDCQTISDAGLIQDLNLKQRKIKILILDEIDKLSKKSQTALLSLLSNGTIEKRLKNESISISIPNLKVFATSNSLAKLTKPIRSRMSEIHLKEYSDEEFVNCCKFCIPSLPVNYTELIAQTLIENNRKDVRTAISVAMLIHPSDSESDIKEVINAKIAMQSNDDEVDYN